MIIVEKWRSSFEVCDDLGIEKERFAQWVRHGFVKATIPADGQGTRARFSPRDFETIKRFASLLEQGYRRKAAAKLSLVK